MLNPHVPFRVKQRYEMLGKWVMRHEALGFMPITSRAAQAQIIEPCAASSIARDDMGYFKGHPISGSGLKQEAHRPCAAAKTA